MSPRMEHAGKMAVDDDASREAVRAGVPVEVRAAESFQSWHRALRDAGNGLERARVLWSARVDGPAAEFWAMRVEVRVRGEDRVKANEVVISRPDASVVALYHPATTLAATPVVLVREYRSPGRSPDGFVHELPGGSGSAGEPMDQAVSELAEETGLILDQSRLRAHGSRQVAASQSTHHVHLYSAQITEAELAALRAEAEPHGLERIGGIEGAGSTERTWVEVTTFGAIVHERLVDWSVLGMLTQALLDGEDDPRYADAGGTRRSRRQSR